MFLTPYIPAIIAGTAVATAAYSVYAGNKSASAQRKALRAQQKMADLEQARERRRLLAETRKKRASIIQAGENVGAGGSSAQIGGAGGVLSELGYNWGWLDEMQEANTESIFHQKKSAKWQQKGSNARAISNISTMFAGDTGFSKLKTSIFGKEVASMPP